MNPVEGRPVSSGTHHPGVEVGDVIALAMAQIIPDRPSPQTYKYGSPRQMWVTTHGPASRSLTTRRGERRMVQRGAGWTGGGPTRRTGTCGRRPRRSTRALFPHVQRARDYRTDSGGAGPVAGPVRQPLREGSPRRRVGVHVRRRDEVPDAGNLRREPGRTERDGDPLRQRRPVPGGAHRRLGPDRGRRAGQLYDYGGGGGWGDPLDRAPQAVLDDVLDEYVERRRRGPRLRGGAHRVPRGLDPRGRRGRHQPALRASRRT